MHVLTGSKDCGNQHSTAISLFPREFESSWIRGKLSGEKSAFVWSEILKLFVNTLTADDMYSRSNIKNLRQQFQTPLSQKQKTFWGFFIAFLKCAWNLEHFQKRDKYPILIISEIIDAQRRG